MNAEKLLQHFERLSEAPDAIPRLRRFILDLAVRGKLVEQDQSDQPALELLGRIETEKLKLIKEGKLKRQEPLSPVNKDELPFPVPHGWMPTRLGVVAACLDYMRQPINGTERDQRIADKNSSELFPYYGATQQQGWIDGYIFDEELVLLGEDGVPFFDDLRRKAYLISGKTWVNNHAHVFRGILVSHAFLAHYLNTFDYKGRVAGATRSKLNQAKAVSIPIILPPLTEQHRIVAMVDELMALCDQLEAAKEEREKRRDRLVAVSFQRLNQPVDDEEVCRKDVRFTFDHLPRLTTCPRHIKQLRQAILNLAVRGKLVPQDLNDEPATKLLHQVAAERSDLVEKGLIRREHPLEPVHLDALPFAIPHNWTWARIGSTVLFTQYGTSQKSHPMDNGVSVLTMGNIQDGQIVYRNEKRIPESSDDLPALYLRKFDILYNRTNSAELVGKTGIYLGEDDVRTFASYLIRIRASQTSGCPHYLNLAMNTSEFRETQIIPLIKKQTGQANVNGTALKNMLIALPPLAEQHRIVAKVDELMKLCDELEAQVTTTETDSLHLLDALLYEALVPRLKKAA